MVSPRTRRTNTQFSTNNCMNILYFNVILNSYLKLNVLYICKLNYSDVLYNISLKEHLPEDGHSRWPKYVGDYANCYKINVYIYIYALADRISHKESSVKIHESFEIQNLFLHGVLYGCETWREERMVGVFENRVLRKIFGTKRKEVIQSKRNCIMRRFMVCTITKY